MKSLSNSTTDKPLFCNVEECSLKFDNRDNLLGHKKKHDMNLNLGSSKTISTDQTPTPTQFIKNCEELGLFQDLQNVNPFEETFKKAAEAVRSGRPISLEKRPEVKPVDDSLHTPNIFPDIPQVINIKQEVEWDEPENLESTEDSFIEDTNSKQIMKEEPAYISNHSSQATILNHNKSAISTKNLMTREKLPQNNVFINVPVPVPVPVQFITTGNNQPCNVLLVKNSDTLYSMPVKNVLNQTLNDKNSDKSIQHKVPISKCPTKKNNVSLSNKFSNFSKNAMKFMSKLDTSSLHSENHDTSEVAPKKKPKVQKKVADIFSKEARTEFLARSRAAASRSREKKKMYIMYLEKVNSELTAKNQSFTLVNVALRKHLKTLHTELLRHKKCSVADQATEAALIKAEKIMTEEKSAKNEKQVLLTFINPPQPVTVIPAPLCASSLVAVEMSGSPPPGEPEFSCLEVAEITLGDQIEDNEIPLRDCSNSATITKFNSVSNVSPPEFPPDSYLGLAIENIPENAKSIHSEHSYFFKRPNLNGDKELGNVKDLRDSKSTFCQKKDLSKSRSRLRISAASKDATNSKKKKESDSRNTPPTVLLKPFKKRKLQKRKKSEKS